MVSNGKFFHSGPKAKDVQKIENYPKQRDPSQCFCQAYSLDPFICDDGLNDCAKQWPGSQTNTKSPHGL